MHHAKRTESNQFNHEGPRASPAPSSYLCSGTPFRTRVPIPSVPGSAVDRLYRCIQSFPPLAKRTIRTFASPSSRAVHRWKGMFRQLDHRSNLRLQPPHRRGAPKHVEPEKVSSRLCSRKVGSWSNLLTLMIDPVRRQKTARSRIRILISCFGHRKPYLRVSRVQCDLF